MSRAVWFRPEAEVELDDAYSWYEHRRVGLGIEFISRVDEALNRIQGDPESFPIVYRTLRQVLVHRFPFVIYYSTDEQRISIAAIVHGSRNPGVWKSRA
jgi:toxin ParE1/3/4